jgi:hypothetical protein
MPKYNCLVFVETCIYLCCYIYSLQPVSLHGSSLIHIIFAQMKAGLGQKLCQSRGKKINVSTKQNNYVQECKVKVGSCCAIKSNESAIIA